MRIPSRRPRGPTMRYPHLEGLERLSPCCKAAIFHNNPMSADTLDEVLSIACSQCNERIDDFLLRNVHGQIVWPIPDIPTEQTEPRKQRKRKRTPEDPDPEPYKLHLDVKLTDMHRWR